MVDRPSDVISLVLADDHLSFRAAVVKLINGASGLRVIADVADGVQALSEIRLQQPRVAVLDVEMPGLTGLDVARAVRDGALPTAIVLLTMHHDLYMVRAAMELGVSAYVLKDDLDTHLMPAILAAAEKRTYFHSSRQAVPAPKTPPANPASSSSRAFGSA